MLTSLLLCPILERAAITVASADSTTMPKEVYHTRGEILRTCQQINSGCVNDSEGRKCSNGSTKCGGNVLKNMSQ